MSLLTGILRLGICDSRAALRTIQKAELTHRYEFQGQAKNPLQMLELCTPVVNKMAAVLDKLQNLRQRPTVTRIYSDVTVFLSVFVESELFQVGRAEPLKDTHDVLHFLGQVCDTMNPARGGYLCLTLKILEMITAIVAFQVIASVFYTEMQRDQQERGLAKL